MIQGSLHMSKMQRSNGPYRLQPKLGLGTLCMSPSCGFDLGW